MSYIVDSQDFDLKHEHDKTLDTFEHAICISLKEHRGVDRARENNPLSPRYKTSNL